MEMEQRHQRGYSDPAARENDRWLEKIAELSDA
jgi:hypothetical protein